MLSNSLRAFLAKIVMHNIEKMLRTCFENWKYARNNKKRVQRQFRMNNVKTVIYKITLTIRNEYSPVVASEQTRHEDARERAII